MLEAPRRVVLDDEIDAVFQRKDPPVDTAYVTVTQMLALCRRALVLNFMNPDTRSDDGDVPLMPGTPIVTKGQVVQGDDFPIVYDAANAAS